MSDTIQIERATAGFVAQQLRHRANEILRASRRRSYAGAHLAEHRSRMRAQASKLDRIADEIERDLRASA